MKTQLIRFLTALPLTALLGCDNAAPLAEEGQDMAPAQVSQAATAVSFSFDSTGLATPPSGGIPTQLLPASAFNEAIVQRGLIGTTEPFTVAEELGARRDLESQTWRYERDSSSGRVLVVNKVESGPATPQEPGVLQRNAVARLQRWGVPSAEIGEIRQVQSFLQNEEVGEVAPAELHRYKTFVLRAINGIRVQGHRAVVTHGVDGGFQRALIRWPALAREGHLLRTRLSTTEIERKATEALVAEGLTTGRVRLNWKYVPRQLTDGTWALTLQVNASLPSITTDTHTEEPRVIDVDVNAVP
ncbi:hypothetical protein LXT21_35090 [Myxococcus sp. K38C18041901]|uniref:hypothetical protein n=1 Tax=Myxococcus guangdongensis TaxID=2906760 RepID=UPI0020A7F4D9|nr:hypothetical protein [Myxococcus guangdongensis]MCP3064015.1 hypothetical protein [Myxococcus guangdongensis]